MRGSTTSPRQFPINGPLKQWLPIGAELRSATCGHATHNLQWRRATLRAERWSFGRIQSSHFCRRHVQSAAAATTCRSRFSSSGDSPSARPTSCGKMQDRNVKLLPQIALNFPLESVEHCVAKRAGRYHRLRAAGLRRQDVLASQLDRDLFVMRGGMEAAALCPAAVIDRAAAQNFSKPLKRDVVAQSRRSHIATADA